MWKSTPFESKKHKLRVTWTQQYDGNQQQVLIDSQSNNKLHIVIIVIITINILTYFLN